MNLCWVNRVLFVHHLVGIPARKQDKLEPNSNHVKWSVNRVYLVISSSTTILSSLLLQVWISTPWLNITIYKKQWTEQICRTHSVIFVVKLNSYLNYKSTDIEYLPNKTNHWANSMNPKTLVLICTIVLFVPSIVFTDVVVTASKGWSLQVQTPPPQPSTCLAPSKKTPTPTEKKRYKDCLVQRLNQISAQKNYTENLILSLTTSDVQKNLNSSLTGPSMDNCSVCKRTVDVLIDNFGCGAFSLNYGKCFALLFVTAGIGAIACTAFVLAAKTNLEELCYKTVESVDYKDQLVDGLCHHTVPVCPANPKFRNGRPWKEYGDKIQINWNSWLDSLSWIWRKWPFNFKQ